VSPSNIEAQLAIWDRWEIKFDTYPPDEYVDWIQAGSRMVDFYVWGALWLVQVFWLVPVLLALPSPGRAIGWVLIGVFIAGFFALIGCSAYWMRRYRRTRAVADFAHRRWLSELNEAA
jgi:hypothetical protein